MTSLEPRTRITPWQDFGLVQRAAAYAADAHRDDHRKGSATPYLSHLWSVAALVLEHGGDDAQVAAALLHDVVEDHGGLERLDDVRREFGSDVADLVEALSDSLADTTSGEAKAPWHERKASYIAHLVDAPERVALVSACDKLHNARCVLSDLREFGGEVWERFNAGPDDVLWYYDSMIDALQPKISARLTDELTRTIRAIRDERHGTGGKSGTVLSPKRWISRCWISGGE